MFKRKILIGLVPVLGAAAVVGSGFSAWHFGNASATASTNAPVVVTDASSSIGTFDTINNTYNVILDQGHLANSGDVTKGIYVLDSTKKDVETQIASGITTETLKAGYKISKTDLQNIVNAGSSVQIDVTFDLGNTTDGLAEYLEFTGSHNLASALTCNFTTTKITWTRTLESKDLQGLTGTDLTLDLSYTFNSTDFASTLLKYKAGKKPTTKEEYETMKTNVLKDQLTITYSATLVNKK